VISVIIPVRNIAQLAGSCLSAIHNTFTTLRSLHETQFILIDDCSDPQTGTLDVLRGFKQTNPAQTTLIRFKIRQFYTYACSLGLSLARGDLVLFLSHDMILTPSYVTTLVNVASTHSTFGIIRGCSTHVDCFPQHVIVPPLPIRSYFDVCAFSEYVARYSKLDVVEDSYLIGDSFLVKRAVLEKIGVMDTSFRHLLGDVDFGLRCRRAGFKIVCAKGAWLYHEGGAHTRNRLARGDSEQQVGNEATDLMSASRALFRSRWGIDLAPGMPAPDAHFDQLAAQSPMQSEFVPPLAIDPNVCEVLG